MADDPKSESFRNIYFNDLPAMESLLRERLSEAPIQFDRIRVSCRPEGTHIQVDCATEEACRAWTLYLDLIRKPQVASLVRTNWRDGYTLLMIVGKFYVHQPDV